MKIGKTLATVAATGALTLGLALGGAGSAHAVRKVMCFGNEYLNLHSRALWPGGSCWADAGRTDVDLHRIFRLKSGNNRGNVSNAAGPVARFSKWQTHNFAETTIKRIWIY